MRISDWSSDVGSSDLTVKDRYLELLPDLLIVDAIGSSETGANGMRVAGKGDTKNQGGGPPVQAARDAVVLDEHLKEVPPGSGQAGRLARRGNVPLAYYNTPERSDASLVAGPDRALPRKDAVRGERG